MTARYDRSRPESPETQARIQQRAAAKRARKAKAFVRAQELTVLGRERAKALAALSESSRLRADDRTSYDEHALTFSLAVRANDRLWAARRARS